MQNIMNLTSTRNPHVGVAVVADYAGQIGFEGRVHYGTFEGSTVPAYWLETGPNDGWNDRYLYLGTTAQCACEQLDFLARVYPDMCNG